MKLTYTEDSATDLNIIAKYMNEKANCNFITNAVKCVEVPREADSLEDFSEMRDHYIAYLCNRFEVCLCSYYKYDHKDPSVDDRLYVLSIVDFDCDLFINNLPENYKRINEYTIYAKFKTLKEALEAINQLQIALIED